RATRALVVLPKRRGVPDPTAPGRILHAELVDVEVPNQLLSSLGVPAKVERGDRDYTTDGALLRQPQHIGGDILYHAPGRELYVLTDPDLIENHGLDDGDNAAVAMRMIDALLPPGGVVVLDETLHGLARPPSLWRELTEMPWWPMTASAVVALAALVWSRA